MPTRFDKIVGNRALTERLCRDIDDGSLSHAYIIEGQEGSGRHTVAKYAAAALCCEERGVGKISPCGQCKSCRKILTNTSPDVITVGLEEDRVTIGVDTIREVRNDIYVAPNDFDVKVYIIENADKMTSQAQSAFLLSLEEPPSYIVFFLICENSTSLLETVRSRAPSLRTERIESAEIKKYLLANDKRAELLAEENPAELDSAIFAATGSIGKAISLLDTRRRHSLLESKSLASNIISMLARADKVAAFSAVAALGNKRADVLKRLASLQEAVRDLILLKKSDDVRLCFFEDRESASELATRFTAASLFALYDASVTARVELDAGSNVRLSLMNMMQRAKLI